MIPKPAKESHIISIRHKADILAVLLFSGNQSCLFRQSADLGFGVVPQRKHGVGQLMLGEMVEHIALVLALIRRFIKIVPASGLIVALADVMTGSQVRDIPFFSFFQQRAEFQIPIALNARIRGFSLKVISGKRFHHPMTKFVPKIQHHMGQPQLFRHRFGVLRFPKGTAPLSVFGGVEHDGRGSDQKLFFEQQQRSRGVHSPAHGHHQFRHSLASFFHPGLPGGFFLPHCFKLCQLFRTGRID